MYANTTKPAKTLVAQLLNEIRIPSLQLCLSKNFNIKNEKSVNLIKSIRG
jgi:hypothetical protein